MFAKRHSLALTAACAVAALLFAVVPAQAARGGYGGSGGRGGWGVGISSGGVGAYYGSGWNGGYYGGRGYYGGSGWNGGYYGGRGDYGGRGWGGYYGGYPNYGSYPYYGSSDYYYTQPYYGTPATTITVTPSYNANVNQAGYATPAAPDNRSRVEVMVPNDSAQVLFDGSPTQQTGTDRVYMTPPLDPGKTYHYTVEAKWMDNGKAMDQTRTVTVAPNQTAVVDFNNR